MGRLEGSTATSVSMKETSAEDLFLLEETAGETCGAVATMVRGERRLLRAEALSGPDGELLTG